MTSSPFLAGLPVTLPRLTSLMVTRMAYTRYLMCPDSLCAAPPHFVIPALQGEELAAAFLGALAEEIAETIDTGGRTSLTDWDHLPPGSEGPGTRTLHLQRVAERATGM